MDSRMPSEIVSSSTFGTIFKTISLSLVLVVTVNFVALWLLERDETNLGIALIKLKWYMLQEMEQPVDWLILGDSSANQGVVPDMMNDRFDITSVNLGTVGDHLAVNDAWMLETYVNKFGPPERVVIVHVYDMWYRKQGARILAYTPLNWGFWWQINPKIDWTPILIAKITVVRYTPLYWRAVTIARLSNPKKWNSEGLNLSNDGFMKVVNAEPYVVDKEIAEHKEFLEGQSFKMSAPNRQALEYITLLAEKHGFDVFIANSPIYEGLYEEPEFREYFEQISESLKEVADQSDRVHYILRDPITFAKDEMSGVDHVIFDTAQIYTEKLSDEIIAIDEANHNARAN